MNDHDRLPRRVDETRWSARFARRLIPALIIAGVCLATPLIAHAGPSDDTLRAGAEVYSSACSACHQPGGVGLPGQFPPLSDNPNVDDADYVATVIHEGLQGPITVDGVAYDGIMPPQSALSDADTDAVIVYMQSGFASPAAADAGDADGSGGLPSWFQWVILAGVVIVLVVFRKRIFGVMDRRTLPWFDAALKTAVIVVGMILLTTIIPARVIESGAVRDLSGEVQDLITLGFWAVGLFGGLWVLWWAHRESRI
jgi:mono/diheme cytochrome c family protein